VKAFALLPVAVLAGCSFSSDIREQVHQTVPATGTSIVHVSNVVGEINVKPWNKNAVDVQAVKSARSMDDLNRITIDAHSEGKNVIVATKYSGGSGSGGVSYTLSVPRTASLIIEDVTGTVDVRGVLGNVSVSAQTGRITADLDRVKGNRLIDLGATTGAVRLSIARDSSARVDASSVVGSFSSDFSSVTVTRTSVVGVTAMGTIGGGTATIRLHTTTGSISLRETP
jgi:hypothetical protein